MAQEQQAVYAIGELAGRFGVSPESLRNWERQRLIPAACRTPGRHRRYTEAHVRAIAMLMNIDGQPQSEGDRQHA